MRSLRIDAVSKNFGALAALKDVSFSVSEGEIVALTGPNGAGKSTLLDVICGFRIPDKGCVSFGGRQLNGLEPHEVARLGIHRTYQSSRVIGAISLLDNLLLATKLSGDRILEVFKPWKWYPQQRAETRRAVEDLSNQGLADKQHELASSLSFGQKRRLVLARAVFSQANLLLLDEPFAGMDSDSRAAAFQSIREYASWGRSVLLVEHDATTITELASRTVNLQAGKVVADTRTTPPRGSLDGSALTGSQG